MKNSSFTLIEISIVLVIIAALATLAVPNVSLFMRKSRDAKRISDMQVLTLAIESFYDDQGSYPGPGHDANVENDGDCIGTKKKEAPAGSKCVGSAVDQAFDNLIKKYIRGPVPRDPLYDNDGENYYYSYDPSHEVDWPETVNFTPGASPACTGIITLVETLAILGLNQFETDSIERHRDTCDGVDMQLDAADYNIAFSEEGLQ